MGILGVIIAALALAIFFGETEALVGVLKVGLALVIVIIFLFIFASF